MIGESVLHLVTSDVESRPIFSIDRPLGDLLWDRVEFVVWDHITNNIRFSIRRSLRKQAHGVEL